MWCRVMNTECTIQTVALPGAPHLPSPVRRGNRVSGVLLAYFFPNSSSHRR